MRAQRLSASRRAGRPALTSSPASSGCAQRISASRRAGPNRGSDALRNTASSAQRLSASRRAGLHPRQSSPSVLDGAQRLSASRRAGPCPCASSSARRSTCSTPLGITASGTFRVVPWKGQFYECSTPLGITASGTVPGMNRVCRCCRAQRLSASRRAGHWYVVHSSVCFSCSTPLGITASGTVSGASVDALLGECSTPLGITASGTPGEDVSSAALIPCSTPLGITASGTLLAAAVRRRGGRAQRLSASRRAGHDYLLLGLNRPKGAQRLSASRRAGRDFDSMSDTFGGPVLNASRHHGERDRLVNQRGQQRLGVLNASRHHGERDSPPKSPSNSANLQSSFQAPPPPSLRLACPGPTQERQLHETTRLFIDHAPIHLSKSLNPMNSQGNSPLSPSRAPATARCLIVSHFTAP